MNNETAKRLGFVVLFIFSFQSSARQINLTVDSNPIKKLRYPNLPSSVLTNTKRKEDRPWKSGPAFLSKLWGLSTIGFFDLFRSYKIQSPYAECSNQIVVAIVDTGIDYTHPALQNNLWKNPGELGEWTAPKGTITSCKNKSCNGKDDDGNGFVDDVIGWDFVHNVPLPFDTHGHGTHIAGIVASQPVEADGIIGVCPNVTVMALKYYDAAVLGYNNLNNTVKAFQYAVASGAHIINYSGGGNDSAETEKQALELARSKGILVIAAAGNNGFNNDRIPYYPASYDLDNIISVASIDQRKDLLSSSNYGLKSVDIAAPGLAILSDLPYGRQGTMSGTSQATAFVTGAAALLASQHIDRSQKINYKEIKRWLVDSSLLSEEKSNLQEKIAGGILSLPRALSLQASDLSRPAVASTPNGPSGK